MQKPDGRSTTTCPHPAHLRHQRYPHGWFCNGCCRFFFGQTSDAIPQTVPPGNHALAADHLRRKREVAAALLAQGIGARL